MPVGFKLAQQVRPFSWMFLFCGHLQTYFCSAVVLLSPSSILCLFSHSLNIWWVPYLTLPCIISLLFSGLTGCSLPLTLPGRRPGTDTISDSAVSHSSFLLYHSFLCADSLDGVWFKPTLMISPISKECTLYLIIKEHISPFSKSFFEHLYVM